MMNSDTLDQACDQLAERLTKESGGDLTFAVNLAYRITLARSRRLKNWTTLWLTSTTIRGG